MQRRLGGKHQVCARDLLPSGTETCTPKAPTYMVRELTVADWTYRRSVVFVPDHATQS
jgi:hypothetical protein